MKFQIWALLSLLALTTATPLWLRRESNINTRASLATNEDYYRLPQTLLPRNYRIELIPYFETPENKNFTFDGRVEIDFEVTEPSVNEIQIHAFDMSIENRDVSVVDQSGNRLSIANIEGLIKNDDRHFYNITMDQALDNGQMYTLRISYVGRLNDDLEGFYRSSYIDANGDQKWMAVTQFEQSGARRAFPCFDEPFFKSKFNIKIAHAPEHNVLSNMPNTDVAQEPPVVGLPGWTYTEFEESVTMSSYLVAFTVSEFVHIKHPYAEDPYYRLWARPGLEGQGHIANNLAPELVNYMEKYTGHDYPLPKVDQIAIPDFSAGAMENWGLITYRESRLLFEEGVSTSANRQSIETVVSHELAHQWFGNLVSPDWWSHTWLNEGFATYYEYHALAPFQETWQLEEQFVYQEMYSVLQTDALNSTHPMLAEVGSPASSSAAFDNIGYNKGGCIVRFMINLLTEEEFKKGINDYLEKKKYGNAVPQDLWDSLTLFVPDGTLPNDVTFSDVMNSWIENAGYPVVSVHRNYDESKTAHVTQQRFLTMPDPEVEYPNWHVPLTYTGQIAPNFDDTEVKKWLFDDVPATNLPAADDQWIIFNPKQTGFYRVNYDEKNWGMLASALDSADMQNIHTINRGQIMDDALALARSSMLSYTLALDTTNYLYRETEYMPWAAALTAMAYLWDRLNFDEQYRSPFESYMLSKLDPAYDLVNGFTITEDDSHVMRYKRSLILKWACELGDSLCNSEANRQFKSWQGQADDWDTINPIDPDLKSVVYCAGMRLGGKTEYDFLFSRYDYAAVSAPSERDLIITALGCTPDTTLLQSYLDESIADNSRIRRQDARSVHTAVYSNYVGVQIALDFVLTNWETCQEVYQGPNNLGRAITGVAGKCNTEEQRDQLQTFLDDTPQLDPSLQTTVQGAVQTVDESLAWHDAHRDTVIQYLMDHSAASRSFFMLPITLLSLVTILSSRLLY